MNLLERHGNTLLVREIALLRSTVRRVRDKHPFHIDAWVVLPEHLHAVMTLPPGDSDFGLRRRLIKSGFSRALPKTERRSMARANAASGNGIIGNISSGMKPITGGTWMMYMSIRRNTAMSNACRTGRIPRSIVMSWLESIRQVGAGTHPQTCKVSADMRPITLC